MNTKRNFLLTLTGVAIFAALIVLLFAILQRNLKLIPGADNPIGQDSPITEPFGKLEQFKSDEQFKEYMQSSQNNVFNGGMMSGRTDDRIMQKSAPMDLNLNRENMPTYDSGDSRVSQTNVQVLGIDEPDILKTDSSHFYYSAPYYYRGNIMPMMEKRAIVPMEGSFNSDFSTSTSIAPPVEPEVKGGILAIQSYPPVSMKKLTTLSSSGDMLLSGNRLIVFDESNWEKRGITGYDVTNASSPKKVWSIPYQSNSQKLSARLYKGRIYLVTSLSAGGDYPCPIQPFDKSVKNGTIACTSIYHPVTPVSNDTLYTVSKIDPATGAIEKNVTFVGSSYGTTINMSRENLFVAYSYSGDMIAVIFQFMQENSEMFPKATIDKVAKLKEYDISQQSKMNEMSIIISRLTVGMDNDKRMAFENNMKNGMEKFMEKHSRDIERTGVVKIDVQNLTIEATGDVPGTVLNQFSMDEYEGNLRIATTTGQNNLFGLASSGQSFSDVYVLHPDMRIAGSVRDLGKTERIYSVRFMADRAYVVTFRQTDPFYVLDMADARNPLLKGELKIPGYSSYLHPLAKDLLVGVGKEGSYVKLSLFNVEDPENPVEVDKFTTNEYWSEALNNHHAFLSDSKHEVLFIPGANGGLVFSYSGNKLSLTKAVSGMQVQRAAYINDFLYIIGQNSIQAYDENNWEKSGELAL